MRKRKQKSPLEVVEMIDESDSSEDSRDEDYELGDDLFTKTSSKGVVKKLTKPRKFTLKRGRPKKYVGSEASGPKLDSEPNFESDSPSPPTTSRLFQIIITRKHARLSSCLQRTYLSLSSEDKYVTISEILSFICECAGFKPNLINRHHLEDSSVEKDFYIDYSSSELSRDNFGWDSFRNCYSDLPTTVTYKDVLKYKDKPELSDELFYGKSISFEHGDSISNEFYSMCNNRMKNLTKKMDIKDGWMIDFGSVGFLRFCEFFSELVLQVEMQYFKDLLLLLQWVFTLSLSPYRSIRFLSCVACNELLSSLLLKLETLKKDQVVLKKQLSVEAELDRRASGRLGATSVNLSGSTLELYKRLSLVNVTCSVISSFVKSSFHLNYSSKFFDVFPDIRVLSAYYLVVHFLINSDLYSNEVYQDLVTNFLVDEDDNLVLLLKYLLIYKRELSPKTVNKLLQIYPSENKEVNHLVEFVLIKYLNPDNKSTDPDTVQLVKNTLFEPEFLHRNLLYNNSTYFCCLFLVNYFPDYQFNLKFNLNLSNIRHKYTYAINPNNKVYNNYVYSYTRKKLDSSSDTNYTPSKYNEKEYNFDNMNTLCNTLMKYQKRDNFSTFVNNLVMSLIDLNFFNLNLSCLRYNNYVNFTTDMDRHLLYNHILVLLVRFTSENSNSTTSSITPGNTTTSTKNNKKESGLDYDTNDVDNKDSRTENVEDFVEHCEELYKLNRNNNTNLYYLFTIYKYLLRFNVENKFKLVELILNNFNNLLNKSGENLTSVTSVCINILSQLLSGETISKENKDNNGNNNSTTSIITNVNTTTSNDAITSLKLDSYKNKVNNLFNNNLLKLVEYVYEVNEEQDNTISTKNNKKDREKYNKNKNKVNKDVDELELLLFSLNHFLISFNFIKLDNKQIFVLFNLVNEKQNRVDDIVDYESDSGSDVVMVEDDERNDTTSSNTRDDNSNTNKEHKERKEEFKDYNNDKLVEWFRRNGLYDELLVLYYLVYEYLIYNVVNDPKYRFEGLDRLQHKLLYLLLNSTGVEKLVVQKNLEKSVDLYKLEKMDSSKSVLSLLLVKPTYFVSLFKDSRFSRQIFVLLSSVFNVLKLSNVDFLNTRNYKFKLDRYFVDRVFELMAFMFFDLYNSQNKKKEDSRVRKVESRENTTTSNNTGSNTTPKDNKENNGNSNSTTSSINVVNTTNSTKNWKDRYSEKNKQQVLSIMNDGSVSINYRYCLQSSGLYDSFDYYCYNKEQNVEREEDEGNEEKDTTTAASNKNKQNKDNEKDKNKNEEQLYVREYRSNKDYDRYLSELNNVYMVESLTYQYTKTLNLDLFNSNLSLMVFVNCCSGVERLKKASLKFVEILNRFNLPLFNLLMLHTMFTLYELSQKRILEGLVNQFNQFLNMEYVEVVYRVMQYVCKNQSNEKFLRYLKMMVFGNVNSKNLEYRSMYTNNNDLNNNSNNSNSNSTTSSITNSNTTTSSTNNKKDEKDHFEEVVVLIKYIKVNSNFHQTEDSYLLRKIANVVKEVSNKVDDEYKYKWFNSNLLMLRRSLPVKLVEELCNSVEYSNSQYSKGNVNTTNGRGRRSSNVSNTTPKDTSTSVSKVNDNSNSTTSSTKNNKKDVMEVKRRGRKKKLVYPSDTTLVSNTEGYFNDMTTDNPLVDSTSNNTTKDGKDSNDNTGSNIRDDNSNTNKEHKDKNKENEQNEEEYNETSDDDSPVVRRYSKRLVGTSMWLKNKAASFGLKGLSFGRGNKNSNSKESKDSNNKKDRENLFNKKEDEEENESFKDFEEYLDELNDSDGDFSMTEFSSKS